MENTSIPLFSASWLAAGPSGPEHGVKIQNNWGVHPENRRTELSRDPKSFASGSYTSSCELSANPVSCPLGPPAPFAGSTPGSTGASSTTRRWVPISPNCTTRDALPRAPGRKQAILAAFWRGAAVGRTVMSRTSAPLRQPDDGCPYDRHRRLGSLETPAYAAGVDAVMCSAAQLHGVHGSRLACVLSGRSRAEPSHNPRPDGAEPEFPSRYPGPVSGRLGSPPASGSLLRHVRPPDPIIGRRRRPRA